MRRSAVWDLARVLAGIAIVGSLAVAILAAPAVPPNGSAVAAASTESSDSAPASSTPSTVTPTTSTPLPANPTTPTTPATSTPTTSTPTTSTPTTSTPLPTPKPKPVDKRPKAPKFVPHKGKAIYVDRKHQRVYLYVNGRQIDTFKCSTSRTLPRRGTYHMKGKRKRSWSLDGTQTLYYEVIFTVGPNGHNIAFHSIPVNSAGHEIAPVGKPVSHGCVRLQYKKARFLYYWITKKTPIIVRA